MSETSSLRKEKIEHEYAVIGVKIKDDQIVADDEFLEINSSDSNSTPNSRNRII